MSCHTWFRKPVAKGTKEVKSYILGKIALHRKKDWWDGECEKEAQRSIKALASLRENMNKELLHYAGYTDTIYFVEGKPVIYDYYEDSSDEPRIGGYPETIIRSAKEMFKAMQTGLTGSNGKHYDFFVEPGREKIIKDHINTFFQKYPDGIIEFG